MIKIISDVDEVLDFAWKMNNDELNASFPREKSIGELRDWIQEYIDKDNYEGLAYYSDGLLSGICLYFSLPEHKYVQTKVLFIKNEIYDAMDEFIDYIGEKHQRYEFFFTGIPFTNEILNRYLLDRDIECIESSIVTKLHDTRPKFINYENLNEINKDNFETYSSFHDKHALTAEMFYNSKNLKDDIDRFKIYSYVDKDIIRGSILAKVVERDAEIFAIFIDNDYENSNVDYILMNKLLNGLYNEFGLLDEIVCFVDDGDDSSLKLVLDSGFKIDAKFKCYKMIF